MALSFAKDIRPLFRDAPDVDSMKKYGLDLSSYAEVKAQAENIYARLADGSMPCDEAWPQDQLDLYKRWTDEVWYAGLGASGAACQPLHRHLFVQILLKSRRT